MKKRKLSLIAPFRSIRHFLAVFILLVILPSLLFGLILAGWSAHRFIEGREDEAHRLAAATAEGMGDHLATITAFTAVLSHIPLDERYQGAFRRLARDFSDQVGYNIALADADGREILSTQASFNSGSSRPRSPESDSAVQEPGRLQISGLIPGRSSDSYVVTVDVPMAAGESLRVLTLSSDAKTISDVLFRISAPDGWILGLIDRRGRLIARRDGENRIGEPAPPEVVYAIRQADHGKISDVSLDGTEMAGFFRRVPGTDWTALVAVPRSSLYSPILGSLALLGGGLAAVLLLTFILACRFIRQVNAATARLVAVAHDSDGEGTKEGQCFREFELVARSLKAAAARRQQLMAVLDLSASMIRGMDGAILHWTRGAEHLSGWSRDAAVGQICHDLLRTQYQEPLESINEKLRETGEWIGEANITRRNGQIARISTRWKMHALEAGQDPVVVETFCDISAETGLELSLGRSQERLRMALDGARVFIFEYDARNDVARREGGVLSTLGLAGQSSGKDFFSSLHPDDRDAFATVMEGLSPLKPAYTFEFRIRLPDGSSRWLSDHARAEFDIHRQMTRLVGISVDITERKQAEQALAREEELLSQIVENIPLLLVVYDPVAKRRRLNRHAQAVLGWSNDEANDGDFLARLYPDPTYRKAALAFMKLKSPEWREWQVATRDGDRIPVDWANFRLSDNTQIAIAIDLRQRKTSERSLARHAERQALLLEVASGLLQTRWDRQELARWVFDHVGPHLEADVGFNFRLDRRDGSLELLACFGVPAEAQAPLRLLQAGQGICGTVAASGRSAILDSTQIHRDEGALLLRTLGLGSYVCHPLLATDGSVLGTFSMGSTRRNAFTREEGDFLKTLSYFMAMAWERRAAEMEVQRLNADLEGRVEARTAQLELSNRELQGFTYAASHDMKGPLGRINSFSTLLEMKYRDGLDEEGLMFLGFIRRNAVRLSKLLDDLLAHAQMDQDSVELQPLDLEGLVCQVLDERDDDIRGSDIRIRLDFPAEGVVALANRHCLNQVLQNLLGNAFKYSAGSDPPTVEIGARRLEGHCRLWIKDNGIGFDMIYHEKIFEIFRRLHTYEEFPGSGVGLALVKKAMDRMQGRVWAESFPGQGATFFLEMRAQALLA